MQVLSALGNLLVFGSLIYYIYSYLCVKAFFKKKNEHFARHDFSRFPVSILKPLKEVFLSWKDNLETFCRQSYPKFEIVIGTSNAENPDLRLALSKLNHCDVRLAVTHQNPGPNYKVGNLISAVSTARYNILAISDADTKVSPEYLKKIVACLLQKDVGLVTCLYRGVNCKNLPAKLEALVVQTDFIPGVLVAEKTRGVKFAFGATIALRRETVKSIGGFEVLYPYLADDYQLGNRVAKKGWKIKIADEIVDHVVGKRRWIDFLRQQLRWAVTCRVCEPTGYFFSILSHGVSLATLNFFLNEHLAFSAILWLVAVGIRYITSYRINSEYIGNKEVEKVLWLLPLKDIFVTIIWAVSFFVNKVYWAGNYFRVRRDGTMEQI